MTDCGTYWHSFYIIIPLFLLLHIDAYQWVTVQPVPAVTSFLQHSFFYFIFLSVSTFLIISLPSLRQSSFQKAARWRDDRGLQRPELELKQDKRGSLHSGASSNFFQPHLTVYFILPPPEGESLFHCLLLCPHLTHCQDFWFTAACVLLSSSVDMMTVCICKYLLMYIRAGQYMDIMIWD